MPKSMVIVESPAKARTIEKYLGRNFSVRACAGHIKDLPARALGVNIKKDFHPTYSVLPGKNKIVKDLKKVAERASAIYLAADPDREGEAICQHLADELDGSESREVHRILLYEITKPAILKAFEQPKPIDRNKVEAQQTRRILDRLVGYKVSPLLWKKIGKGLSAGRVQSVALRMVVEREKKIQSFIPEEYWNFTAHLRSTVPPTFEAKAVKRKGKKFKVSNQEEADSLMQELGSVEFRVSDVRKKAKKQNPTAPFTTSKLQQEAARRLRFSVRKTMTVAQRLYEGVDQGDGERVGLITYMRTDSTRVSATALEEVRQFVADSYGTDYLPRRALVYRRNKGAQDAHEAIRPTSVLREPSVLRGFLNQDEYRLYELIWRRFIASQMKPAIFDQTEFTITAGSVQFKTMGAVLRFDGFLKLYKNEKSETTAEQHRSLPPVTEGELLKLEKIIPEQKFTQPAPRYTEATLVKAMEERGIGRPSTYAQIISVIQHRDYVVKRDGRFVPSELGEIVVQTLLENFREIFDYDYTAKLEQSLDEIEEGKKNWILTLKDFYGDFSQELNQAREQMKKSKKEERLAGVKCDKCDSEMVVRWGRFGKFIACRNFPECKNTREVNSEEGSASLKSDQPCEKCGSPMVPRKGPYGIFFACSNHPECQNTRRVDGTRDGEMDKDLLIAEPCPKCSAPLIVKQGRFGKFVACTNYPKCRYIKQETTGVTCPECGKGEIVKRRSKRGRTFYSCNAFPDCKFVLWSRPVSSICPNCGSPFLLEKSTKKEGLVHFCHNKSDCSYSHTVEVATAR